MIELKGNNECWFLDADLYKYLNNLPGEIGNDNIKFVFFFKPDEMIEYLYSTKTPFKLEYFGHGTAIYVPLSECLQRSL